MCFFKKKKKQAENEPAAAEQAGQANAADTQTEPAYENPEPVSGAAEAEASAEAPQDGGGSGASCGFDTAVRPGQTVRVSGQYMQVDAQCNPSDTEATLVKGKTVPPTQHADQQYVLVDETKHK